MATQTYGTNSAGGIIWQADDGAAKINGATPYLSKADNGYYLVRFTVVGQTGELLYRVIAVRSAAEIPNEVMKTMVSTVALTDAGVLKAHVAAYIAGGTPPLENTIGA